MHTTGILTTKTFKAQTSENEKLNLLSGQMGQLGDDFEDMKRTREEAKKKLDAKFEDVYRKIQNTKDFITAEGQRINNTMLAFENKFEKELSNIKTYFNDLHDQDMQYCNDNFNRIDGRCDDLDKKIDQEIEDREKQTEDNLREIKKQLGTLFDMAETEKNTRTENEKMILLKLDTEAFHLNQALDKEKSERILKTKELRDDTNHELTSQQKANEDFNRKSIDEFEHIVNNLSSEMDNRFDHQNQVVDHLSNVIKTIQGTLKVIGKDV